MAPYRNNRTGNRSTRTQIDHDVFEGLPVRHWRKAPVVVNAAPQKENSNLASVRSVGWPELPMPRDAPLLSPMSQALLRAARMGQVNKPPPSPLEDEKDVGDDEDGDGDMDAGFVARRWALVPRHLEGPEPEYLAKRRKGLPSVYGGTVKPQTTSGHMRKTKIRKTDTEGKSSVWDVLVPEGQTVAGEIGEAETTRTQAPAPGTIVEGVGVVNAEGLVIAGDRVVPTPPKRRHPPPKRKGKGPGRGRRKRVGFVSITSGATAAQRANMGTNGAVIRNGVQKLDVARVQRVGQADTEMGEDLILQDGEDGGEEGSEDDEEGDEGEDNDREEGELSPSPSLLPKSPSKPHVPKVVEPMLLPEIPELTLTEPEIPITRDLSSSPDLPLAAAGGQGFQQTALAFALAPTPAPGPAPVRPSARPSTPVSAPAPASAPGPTPAFAPGPGPLARAPFPAPALALSRAPAPFLAPAPTPSRVPALFLAPAPAPSRAPTPSPAPSRVPAPSRAPAPSPARILAPAPASASSSTSIPASAPYSTSISASAPSPTPVAPAPVSTPAPAPAPLSAPAPAAAPPPAPPPASAPALTSALTSAPTSAPAPAPPPAPSPAPPPVLAPAPPTLAHPLPAAPHLRTTAPASSIKIDPIRETLIVPAPEMYQIPVTEQITVEEAPRPECKSANAKLPASHDPLDGLTEPKVPLANKVLTIPPHEEYNHHQHPAVTQHFMDGEEDLLGSLERSLDRRSDVR